MFTDPLAKAIRVALLASASVRAPQVLDNANLDMGTNNFSVVVQKRITTTRPAANEILYHKHDGTTGVIVTLLTTGIVRLTLNATTFDSTTALTSASNVEPVIIIPVTRETTTAAGSVTFVVDGVQLGTALVISARVEKITNGTFATDITGWTITTGSPGSIAWDAAGKLRVTRSGSTLAAYQAVSVAAGETLFVSCAATSVSGASTRPALVLKSDATPSGGTTYTSVALSAAASGTMRVSYYAATATTVYVHLQVGTADGVYDFDTVTSLDTYSVDNASNLYLLGTSTTTTEGAYYDGAIYNRALTVAECLAYCLRGPDVIDMGGSQTDLVSGWDFTSGWTASSATNTDANTITFSASNGYSRKTYSMTLGKRYALRFKGTTDTTLRIQNQSLTENYVSSISPGSFDATYTFTPTLSTTGIAIKTIAGAGYVDVDIMELRPLGITGHWPAFNAQANTGQLFDQSGNKNHMLLPASGATILGTPQSMRRQVRWTNTWAATQELQYIGGVNQAILPTNAYIESIVGTVSGATPHDIIIGDGSTTNRYVTITTGLATGTTTFTLANRVTDGTNLKLTVDPDTDATMSIAWVITYTTLET